MARPVSPVVPGLGLPVTVHAKNQPQYEELPAFRLLDGTVLSRWKLTWRERLIVLFRGDVYLWLMTFNTPIQPSQIQIERPSQTDLARSQEHARHLIERVSEASRERKIAVGALLAFIAAGLLFVLSGSENSRRSIGHAARSVTPGPVTDGRPVTSPDGHASEVAAVESRDTIASDVQSRSSSHVFGDADSDTAESRLTEVTPKSEVER